jgi:hypothetical protein
MGFWSDLRRIFFASMLTPEKKVNMLSAIVVESKRHSKASERLRILRSCEAVDELKLISQGVQRICDELGEAEPDDSVFISYYIIEIANAILDLLGEERQFPFGGSTPRIREILARQKARINWAKIDRQALITTLFDSFDIKSAWRASADTPSSRPTKLAKMFPVSPLEQQTKDEWLKSHPMID